MLLVLPLLGALAGAAPAASNPFAGTYSWGYAPITITNGGRISGSSYVVYPSGPLGGYDRVWTEVRGRVSAAGAMSISVATKVTNWAGVTSKYTYDYSGQATLDVGGNLVLVTGDGLTLTFARW